MSRTDRDQAGGHPRRLKALSGKLACGCCEHLPPRTKDPIRARRNRAAWAFESVAEFDGAELAPHPFHLNCARLCAESAPDQDTTPWREHLDHLGRCTYCGIDLMTLQIPGPDAICRPERTGVQISYSTSTIDPRQETTT